MNSGSADGWHHVKPVEEFLRVSESEAATDFLKLTAANDPMEKW
jgi:hypothetical protein